MHVIFPIENEYPKTRGRTAPMTKDERIATLFKILIIRFDNNFLYFVKVFKLFSLSSAISNR
jgi:hypothetical protein